MRRTSKALATLATVVALLTLTASPSTAETAVITSGTLTINTVPPFTRVLGGTTSCPETITGAFTTSLTSATSTLTLVDHFVYSGQNFIFQIAATAHASSTHITTGTDASKHFMDFDGSTTSSNIVATNVMVYTSDSATDCDPSNNTAKCGNLDASMPHFYGILTTPTGTTVTHDTTTSRHSLPVSSTLVFSGTTTFNPPTVMIANIAAAGCTPPFAALNGKTATISGMTSHVTSSTP